MHATHAGCPVVWIIFVVTLYMQVRKCKRIWERERSSHGACQIRSNKETFSNEKWIMSMCTWQRKWRERAMHLSINQQWLFHIHVKRWLLTQISNKTIITRIHHTLRILSFHSYMSCTCNVCWEWKGGPGSIHHDTMCFASFKCRTRR